MAIPTHIWHPKKNQKSKPCKYCQSSEDLEREGMMAEHCRECRLLRQQLEWERANSAQLMKHCETLRKELGHKVSLKQSLQESVSTLAAIALDVADHMESEARRIRERVDDAN